MKDLIKIENTSIGDAFVPTVSARELHEFLGVGKHFATWVSNRLTTLGAEENKDFLILPQSGKNSGRPRNEYFLTIDIAKHLAMMERNEIRDYFIECEKEYKKTIENYIPKTLPDALELRKHEETKLLLKEAEPKIDFYDIAVASSSTIDIGEAAKILKYKGTGRNNLFKFLRREGVLMKNNIPKQEYVNKGWLKLVEYKVNGEVIASYGSLNHSKPTASSLGNEVKIKTLVHLSALPNRRSGMSLFRGDYQKGLDGIRKMLNEAGLLPEER